MLVKNFSDADITTRVSWINDSSINTSMYFHLPATIEQTQKWYQSNKTKTNRKDFTFFTDNNIVAMGGLVSIDTESNHAELYIMVNPDLHGQAARCQTLSLGRARRLAQQAHTGAQERSA